MRRIPLAICFILIASIHLFAENTRRDGNWWRDLSTAEKYSYMTGFFDGMDLGNNFSWWGSKNSDGKADVALLSKVGESYAKMTDKYFKHVTNTQVADGLNVFFEDYRNRSITISDAVWVVLRTVAGEPSDEIEKLTQNLRVNAAKN